MGEEKGFTEGELAQFIGTENWYRHTFVRNVHYTDGMLFVAERAGAYWLIDEIALAQKAEGALMNGEFQVWTLIVEGSTALLRCDDGNDRCLLEKRIEYTDFPEPGLKLYVVDGVIMLPGEY
jgi:hypothetical protein